jgi:hypothetical protein
MVLETISKFAGCRIFKRETRSDFSMMMVSMIVLSRPIHNFALPTSTSFISATSRALRKRETAL